MSDKELSLSLGGGWDDILLHVPDIEVTPDTMIYADVSLTAPGPLPLRFSFRNGKTGEEFDFWGEYSPGRTARLFRGRDLAARTAISTSRFDELRFGGQGVGEIEIVVAIVRGDTLLFGAA